MNLRLRSKVCSFYHGLLILLLLAYIANVRREVRTLKIIKVILPFFGEWFKKYGSFSFHHFKELTWVSRKALVTETAQQRETIKFKGFGEREHMMVNHSYQFSS